MLIRASFQHKTARLRRGEMRSNSRRNDEVQPYAARNTGAGRTKELRTGALSHDAIDERNHAVIALLRNAVLRDYAKWHAARSRS